MSWSVAIAHYLLPGSDGRPVTLPGHPAVYLVKVKVQAPTYTLIGYPTLLDHFVERVDRFAVEIPGERLDTDLSHGAPFVINRKAARALTPTALY